VADKNYAYKVIDTETGGATTVSKVRGITQNYSANQLVNFDVIRDMVFGTSEEPTVNYIRRRRLSLRGRVKVELWPLALNPRLRLTVSRSTNVDI